MALSPKDPETPLKVRKEHLLELTIRSLVISRQNSVIEMQLSGTVHPLLGVPSLQWPEFDIKSLTIDSNGKSKVEGGWLNLSEAKKLNFYGFTLELAKLGFGTEEINGETWNWIGFNGALNLAKGLPSARICRGPSDILELKDL